MTVNLKTMAKAAKKKTTNSEHKNKLGVENSLVNNINASKEKGISRDKSEHTVSKKSYKKMEDGWKK